MTYGHSYGYFDEELNEHKAKMRAMRERQEADQKAMAEKQEAAMKTMKMQDDNQANEMKTLIESDEEEILAAIQAFEIKVAARRLYHEAPDDVFEMIVTTLSDVDQTGKGKGGLNVLRLVSKRCLRVVESVATRLTGRGDVRTLPVVVINRCKRIEHIRCGGVDSLEGCPDGLKSLIISDGSSLESLEPLSACKELETLEIIQAHLISDLSPLSLCTRLKKLKIKWSNVTDLSPLSSMSDLEDLYLLMVGETMNDLSIIPQCKKMKIITIGGNGEIKDLSPLSQCPDLEELHISLLPLIKDLSFFENGFATLRVLSIIRLPIDDFSPLVKLHNLMELDCYGMPSSTSLLPLASCSKLKKLICSRNAKDMDELRERRPDVEFDTSKMYRTI